MKTCRYIECGSVAEPGRDEAELLAVRAEEWLERLKTSGDPCNGGEFLRWLKESPLHVREMLLAVTVDQLLAGVLDPERKIDIDVPMPRHGTHAAERAKEWLERMRRSRSPIARAGCWAWLKQSPLHVREMLVLTTWGDPLDAKPAPEEKTSLDARSRREEAVKSSGDAVIRGVAITGMPRGTQGQRAGWSWAARWSVAAAFIISLAPGWSDFTIRSTPPQQQFETATGEQRTASLPDGSIVHLNTRTRVNVDFSDKARDVYLLDGQAIFKVEHDASRPFRVHVDSAMVQAVGTQFDVYRAKSQTNVAVIEGVVQVVPNATVNADPQALSQPPKSRRVSAGELVVVTADGKMARGAVDVCEVVAWRQRRLCFNRKKLEYITAEFNRYNEAPKIRIEGEALKTTTYSGVFDIDDPESFIEYLHDDHRLAFDRRADVITIRVRSGYARAQPAEEITIPDLAE